MLEQPQAGLISRFYRQVENRLKKKKKIIQLLLHYTFKFNGAAVGTKKIQCSCHTYIQGSLYVRDELSYMFAGIVLFYNHFPQRSVTKIDIMSKFWIFFSKWHIFYLNKHLQFRIFVLKWRLWFFATGTAVELPNLWASIFLKHFLEYFFEIFQKTNITNEILMKNDDFRGATHEYEN